MEEEGELLGLMRCDRNGAIELGSEEWGLLSESACDAMDAH